MKQLFSQLAIPAGARLFNNFNAMTCKPLRTDVQPGQWVGTQDENRRSE